MAGMARGAGAARAGGAAATAATDVGSGGRLSLSLEPARCHKSSAASGAGSPSPPPPRFPLRSGLQVLSPPSFQFLWGRLPSPLLLPSRFSLLPWLARTLGKASVGGSGSPRPSPWREGAARPDMRTLLPSPFPLANGSPRPRKLPSSLRALSFLRSLF